MFPEIKTQTTKPLKNEDGFTIIEVLMAVIILSLGMMAYGVTSGSIMTRNTHSTQESISITLAQDILEEYKNINLNSLVPPGGIFDSSISVNEEGNDTGNHRVYLRKLHIERTSQPCDCYYDLNVQVSWNNNGDHTVELNTQISQ